VHKSFIDLDSLVEGLIKTNPKRDHKILVPNTTAVQSLWPYENCMNELTSSSLCPLIVSICAYLNFYLTSLTFTVKIFKFSVDKLQTSILIFCIFMVVVKHSWLLIVNFFFQKPYSRTCPLYFLCINVWPMLLGYSTQSHSPTNVHNKVTNCT
jgi:hypothetical protein